MPELNVYKKQRGGLGILGIITLLLAVLFATITVDSGRLMMEKRHLQTVADMAALEASMQMGSCGNALDIESLQALADANAVKNNFSDGTLLVRVGRIDVNESGLRQFTETALASATAVKVDVSKSVPASLFAGQTFGQWAMLGAAAVAERQAYAGFSAGTTLLSLSNPNVAMLNQLFSSILGSPVNLDLASYQGIAVTSLELADLVSASVGAGNVSELVNSTLTLGEAFTLYSGAVNLSDTADVAVINALDSLLAANTNNYNFRVSDVLDITTSNLDQATKATVSLLDLVTTSLLVANGTNAINLPSSISLPSGLINLNTLMTVIEPPKIAIGPPGLNDDNEWRTVIETAQVRLQTNIQSAITLNVAGLIGAKASLDLALIVNIAQGIAGLRSIQCSRYGSNENIVTIMSDPGIASVRLTRATNTSASAGTVDISAKVLLAEPSIADVDVGLSLDLDNSSPIDIVFTVDGSDDNALPTMQRAATPLGGALTNIPQDVQLNVTLLGVVNLPLLDELIEEAILTQILTPLLGNLATTTIDPILSVLGIQTGVMDVQLFTVNVDRPGIKR